MVSRVAVLGTLGALIASGSCSKPDGGDLVGPPPSAPRSAAKAGSSSGSFSAELARELGASSAGPGSAGKSDGTKSTTRSGGDVPPSGGTVAGGTAAGGTAAGGTAAGSSGGAAAPDAVARSGVAASNAGTTAAEPASAPAEPPPRTASASAPVEPPPRTASASAPVEPPPRTASASAPAPAPSVDAVKVPTDLAAIKISLLPNWDRDVATAGTFQYVVRIKGTQGTKTFAFRYGYDDPRAPKDHEQYKKYLQDTGALTGEIRDRQRGAAWFLEGNDAAGMPAFRYVVLYGGKQLICYGSLYKDADSNRLGDDRDQTVIQAKQICETLAL